MSDSEHPANITSPSSVKPAATSAGPAGPAGQHGTRRVSARNKGKDVNYNLAASPPKSAPSPKSAPLPKPAPAKAVKFIKVQTSKARAITTTLDPRPVQGGDEMDMDNAAMPRTDAEAQRASRATWATRRLMARITDHVWLTDLPTYRGGERWYKVEWKAGAPQRTSWEQHEAIPLALLVKYIRTKIPGPFNRNNPGLHDDLVEFECLWAQLPDHYPEKRYWAPFMRRPEAEAERGDVDVIDDYDTEMD